MPRGTGLTAIPLTLLTLAVTGCATSTPVPASTVAPTASGILADTWTLTGLKWRRASVKVAPSRRSGAVMTYDPVRKETVLFGGSGPSGLLGDTWIWNGATWHQAMPIHSPPARVDAGMAFDAGRGVAVLFAGSESGRGEGSLGRDVWEWNGVDWTAVNTPQTAPAIRSGAMLAYVPARRAVVMAGGHQVNHAYFVDTWAWDGSTWTELSRAGGLPERSDSATAYDPVRSEVVSFGGMVERPGAGPGNLGLTTAGTFVLSADSWTERIAAGGPGARSAAAMAFDRRLGVVVMFGGFACPSLPKGLWTWDGRTWTVIDAGDGPAARWGATMAYDDAHGQITLFGGSSVACS